MFVGSVYWFLSMATSLDGCRVSIFDCTSGNVVWDSDNYDGYDIAAEVDYQGFGDYDIFSYDMFLGDNNKVCLEINIAMEGEDE